MSSQEVVADTESLYMADPNIKKEDVEVLKHWISKQPHLPIISEAQIIFFLHSCYYSLESAKSTLDNFFTFRTLCPELFGFPPIEQIKAQSNVTTVVRLPNNTQEGYTIFFGKLLNTDSSCYDFAGQINFLDKVIYLDLAQNGIIDGVRLALDWKGYNFGHFIKFNLVLLKHFIFYAQDANPVRVKGLHFFNINPLFEKILSLCKPFIKKELYDLLYFHKDVYEMQKYIPQKFLPEEYGGAAPSTLELTQESADAVVKNAKIFISLENQKVDESKRVGKSQWSSELFGTAGSFRKIELD